MERRFLAFDKHPVQLEQRGSDPPRVIGYGAVYYDGTPSSEYILWEGVKERIVPGAFDKTIKEDDIRALFNHNPDYLLGRKSANTLKLRADNTGLNYDILLPNTNCGRDTKESITRNDLTGSSFSFQVRSQKWTKLPDGSAIRKLLDVQVADVGPVTFPAYEGTTAKMRDDVAFGGGIPVTGGTNSRPHPCRAFDDLVEARMAYDKFVGLRPNDDKMLELLLGYRRRVAHVLGIEAGLSPEELQGK